MKLVLQNRLALQHAEATGIQKLILMTKHGVQIIWDGIKRGVMFVYNKAVQFLNGCGMVFNQCGNG